MINQVGEIFSFFLALKVNRRLMCDGWCKVDVEKTGNILRRAGGERGAAASQNPRRPVFKRSYIGEYWSISLPAGWPS